MICHGGGRPRVQPHAILIWSIFVQIDREDARPMNIIKSTDRFEEWLARHTAIVQPDLRLKHARMAESPFSFLRATFYRWMQLWPEVCPALDKAPRVLAVGDLHIENFGTWRDVEGRLIWGVNDFDEAAVLPFTLDLVRLAVSVALATEAGHMRLKLKAACDVILEGFRESLAAHGRPFCSGRRAWLAAADGVGRVADLVHFWEKMAGLPKMERVPASAQEALEHVMPEHGLGYKTVRRVAGLGSLGHVRVVAVAECRGGKVAREAKALVPSSVHWAQKQNGPHEILYQAIISRAVRCPDPFAQLRGHWIVRRLSPHCSRIELSVLPSNRTS